jgi:glutathione S-transferase
VTLLALVQFVVFGMLVGRARHRHNVPAPAMAGHEIFERYMRVHMNTLEQMVVMLPSLWIAAVYWPPVYMAALGAIYLIGRQLYLQGYVKDPAKRSLGFGLTMFPILALLILAMFGVIRSLARG